MRLSPLYHWSPTARRESIFRDGLKPYSDAVVSTISMPYICFGTTPSAAWGLSGDMGWTSDHEEWDLWQVHLEDHDEVHIRAEWGPNIKEVRVHNAIPPDRLWWVGQRTPMYGKQIERKTSKRTRGPRKK